MNCSKNNIYRRKDGRWEGRYVKGRKPDGTIQYGYVYRRSFAEAHIALQSKKRYGYETAPHQGGFPGTCEEWFRLWLSIDVKERVKSSTYIRYQQNCQNYIIPEIGAVPLNHLTAERVQRLVDYWHQQVSQSTLDTSYRILNHGLKAAVAHHYLELNPCDSIMQQ